MEKGKLLGQGRTAEVFEYGDDKIIKLFREFIPVDVINREYENSLKAEKSGLPIPAVIDIIDVENRKGIVYGRINGITMLNAILHKPWSMKSQARHMAELHCSMHKCAASGLMLYKRMLEWNINHTGRLDKNRKSIILKYLFSLPDEDKLCHGDFHPDNIIISKDKFVIIDWMNASCGSPAADVARTSLMLRIGELPDDKPQIVGSIIKKFRESFHEEYLKTYLRLSGISREQITMWELPVAAARLYEGLSENEKKQLEQLIDLRLKEII